MTVATNIYEAIVEVRKLVPYVQKNRKMTSGGNYNYADIEAFIECLKPSMDEAGIVVLPVGSDLVHQEQFESRHGAKMHRVINRVRYQFFHAASQTSTPPIEVMGEADDAGDKAIPKTFTLALKQALRQTFLVETGDTDPDNHPSQTRNGNGQGNSVLFESCRAAVAGAANQEGVSAAWLLVCGHHKAGKLSDEHLEAVRKLVAERKAALAAGAARTAGGSGAADPKNANQKKLPPKK